MTNDTNDQPADAPSVGGASESIPVPDGVEETFTDAATEASVLVNGDRLAAVQHIGSAIRSASTTLVVLPIRPELRRSRNALIALGLLLPVVILIVTVLIQVLAAFVSWDDLGREGRTVVSPTASADHKFPAIVYFGPAFALVWFALLTFVIPAYEFTRATTASKGWIYHTPVILISLALIWVGVLLVAGVVDRDLVLTLAGVILVIIVLPFATLVNWLTGVLIGNNPPSKFVYRAVRCAAILVLCVAVVGAGLGMIIGIDARDIGSRDRQNTGEAATSDSERAEGGSLADVHVGEPSLTSPLPEAETPSDAEFGQPEDTNPSWTLTGFFLLVGTLTISGVWWSNNMIIRVATVTGYTRVACSVAKCAVPNSIRSDKGVRDRLIVEISGKLGDALSRTRSIEFADYLQAVSPAKPVKSMRQAGGLLNPWMASALRGGIEFACDTSSTERDGYYAIYFHIVHSVAGQLYEQFADCGGPLPRPLPPDVLVAAKRMCEEVADLFYRCKLPSLVKKHVPMAAKT